MSTDTTAEPVVRRALVLLSFAVATALAVATATDPDLWWHLRTGELIVTDGIPRVDPFSFTVAGQAWVTHEWGSQVLMWGLWSAGGATALIVTFTAMVVLTWWVAYRTSRARPLVTAAIVVLAAATARIATAPRPQMLNLLGLALVILLLERVRSGALGPRALWSLPAIVAVWANLHSGYLLGVVVIAVYAVGEQLEQRRTGGRPMPVGVTNRLGAVAGVSMVAALANPSGLAMWTYPFETLRSDAMRTHIREWHSPDFHSPWFWPFLAYLVLAAVSVAFSTRKPGATQALLLAGTAVAGLQSMRHIPLFAVVALPIVAEQVEVAIDARRARAALGGRTGASALAGSRPIAVLTGALGVVVAVMFGAAAIGVNDRATAEIYPVDAVDALIDSGLADEPGFNAYGWGGYLVWRGVPVFIDGRADVYGDEFMEFYFTAEEARPGWRDTLDAHDVGWALLAPGDDLAVVLDEAADWSRVYADDVAEIWVRCTDTDCPVLPAPPSD